MFDLWRIRRLGARLQFLGVLCLTGWPPGSSEFVHEDVTFATEGTFCIVRTCTDIICEVIRITKTIFFDVLHVICVGLARLSLLQKAFKSWTLFLVTVYDLFVYLKLEQFLPINVDSNERYSVVIIDDTY